MAEIVQEAGHREEYLDISHTVKLDASDPLAMFRSRFHIPTKADLKRPTIVKSDNEPHPNECIYLYEFSLGRVDFWNDAVEQAHMHGATLIQNHHCLLVTRRPYSRCRLTPTYRAGTTISHPFSVFGDRKLRKAAEALRSNPGALSHHSSSLSPDSGYLSNTKSVVPQSVFVA